MKPTAATVLPAPVACSNQKRRLAPGSSGASSTTSASSSASSQSLGSSSGASSSLSSSSSSSSSVTLPLSEEAATGSSLVSGPLEPFFERPLDGAPSSMSAISAARVPESAST